MSGKDGNVSHNGQLTAHQGQQTVRQTETDSQTEELASTCTWISMISFHINQQGQYLKRQLLDYTSIP